ncbi:MAG: hypothetical protein DBY45_03980 [Clostridiales bacterium]|nr:MAG: hypothetical protein DBY45_03980 [Clostridiales bacterium]
MDLKKYLSRNPKGLKWLVHLYNRTAGFNSIRRGKNRICVGASLLKRTKIRISGEGNTVVFSDWSALFHCAIQITGNYNRIEIGPDCVLRQVELVIEDDGNVISVGKGGRLYGPTQLAAIEGTKIFVGEDCLFSSGVKIRTGDSHSIVNMDGNRINPSEDVVIGEHVWLGTDVLCLKGTRVPGHCIVGARSLVNRAFSEENCILAGVPARIVKTEVDYLCKRL